ncbi:hypothetical protein TRIUR3_23909 [Triticum urartu]|uniref:Uncharacterized protein n=1 Tax=Triticum urartu TaxID=4572 RepID=M7YUP0_TRIUA|nr:hypothetical protein TRIUR3_23909 [Triticum urartu]
MVLQKLEKPKHKKKRLAQSPNSFFMDVSLCNFDIEMLMCEKRIGDQQGDHRPDFTGVSNINDISSVMAAGCSLGDRTKFGNTMKACLNFSSIEGMHKEANAVVRKAMTEELKTLIPDPAKGATSVYILRWAMNQADSVDAGQRARWTKYRAPQDQISCSSYGDLVYYCDGGVHRCGGFNSTSPIQCQMLEKFYQNGILKAPLASPPTHISFSVWHVGSDSWSEVQYPDLVEFSDQFLLSDGFGSWWFAPEEDGEAGRKRERWRQDSRGSSVMVDPPSLSEGSEGEAAGLLPPLLETSRTSVGDLEARVHGGFPRAGVDQSTEKKGTSDLWLA